MKCKKLQYCVVHFLELPYKSIDDYVCIPSSWIVLRLEWNRSKAAVAYPVENLPDMEERVKKRQKISDEWRFYMAIAQYDTDSYADAQIFIKDMITGVHNEDKCPNKNNGEQDLSERMPLKSKRKLNQLADIPQKVISKEKNNDAKPAKKTRMERITIMMRIATVVAHNFDRKTSTGGQRPPPSVIASTGPASLATVTKTAESSSKVAFLPKQTSETTNENQTSLAHEDIPIENSSTQEIPVIESNYENRAGEPVNIESSSYITPTGIQNQKNQSLDPANNFNYENRAEETIVLESSTQNRPSVITHTSEVIANSLTSSMPLKKMILARCNFNS